MSEPTTPLHPAARPEDPAAVVARAADGDDAAWAELVARYARRIYALVRSRSVRPDIAEEVTQSVFVTLAEQFGAGAYREEGRFEAWLFRIVLNRLRDALRAERRRARALEGRRRNRPTPGADPIENDETMRLRAAVAALPEKDREVVSLRHHAGLEFNKIAAVLGEPIGTVLARHHRALAKLRTMLDTEGDPR